MDHGDGEPKALVCSQGANAGTEKSQWAARAVFRVKWRRVEARESLEKPAALEKSEHNRANECNRHVRCNEVQSADEAHGAISLNSTHAEHHSPAKLSRSRPAKKTAVLSCSSADRSGTGRGRMSQCENMVKFK
jgi:hypothetical protein